MAKSQDFTASQIPRLDGYVAIVTGGNAGIGFETTIQLARKGARVYIASRSQARVEEAIVKMKQTEPTLDVRFLKLDLQDFQSIRAALVEFKEKETKLDLLINNAGIMASPYEVTKDGHEIQWQTCFLGHHALTLGLLPLLRQTARQDPGSKARVRVVNVASDAAFAFGPKAIALDDTNMTNVCGGTAPWKRYGHCKQASIIAAKAINNRYEQEGVAAYSLHPGIIKSNLQSHAPGVLGGLTRVAVKVLPTLTVEEGARNTLYCATSHEASVQGGLYFAPVGKVDDRADRWIQDGKAVQDLWDLSINQLKQGGFALDL